MNVRHKWLSALGTMALAVLLIGTGTFALFTDEATNEHNSFAAGTLSIEDITNGDGRAAFQVENLAPGDNTGHMHESNDTFVIQTHPACGTPNPPWWCDDHGDGGHDGGNNGNGDDNDHGNGDDPGAGTHEPGEITVINDGTLKAWVKLSDVVTDGFLLDEAGEFPIEIEIDDTPVLLEPEEEVTYEIHWSFPIEADTSYQNTEGTATFLFDAVQADNNTKESGEGPHSWNEDAS